MPKKLKGEGERLTRLFLPSRVCIALFLNKQLYVTGGFGCAEVFARSAGEDSYGSPRQLVFKPIEIHDKQTKHGHIHG